MYANWLVPNSGNIVYMSALMETCAFPAALTAEAAVWHPNSLQSSLLQNVIVCYYIPFILSRAPARWPLVVLL